MVYLCCSLNEYQETLFRTVIERKCTNELKYWSRDVGKTRVSTSLYRSRKMFTTTSRSHLLPQVSFRTTIDTLPNPEGRGRV